MIYEKKSYRLYPGETGFIDPALLYVDILSVDREGTGYEVKLSGSASDRDCVYDETNGSVYFRDPANDLSEPAVSYDRTEIVNVIYKYT